MSTLRKALRIERDLEVIWDYLAADNPEAVERCLAKLMPNSTKLHEALSSAGNVKTWPQASDHSPSTVM
jgi:hypothetical protein